MHCPFVSGQRCGRFDSYQEPEQRQTYCMSPDNYTKCLNWKPNSKNCPYFTGSRCKQFDTYQEGYHKQEYCLNSANCTRCANFK